MITSEEIKRRLWDGANELRGSMDASRYKDYMLGLMFYKFLSDKTLDAFKISAGLGQIKEEELVKIRSTFSAEWVSENQTYKTIAQVFRGHGYLMDPHTAVAWKAGELYQRHTADNSPMVVLSTASPFKFPSSVLKSFDRTAILPDSAQAQVMMLQSVTGKKAPLCIGSLFGKQVRFQDLVKPDEMMAYVMDKEKTL